MKKTNELRPDIATVTTGAELRRWYWLKVELADAARRFGVKCTGAKFTILERLCHFLDTGEPVWPGDKSAKLASKFDWHASPLSDETIITDNYKNTQNVRRYFQTQVDPGFKFNIGLIDWFRNNVGKTLADAGRFWKAQQANPEKTKIKPHNQFNQYARDIMDANPELGMKDARKYWARKRMLPTKSGRHVYESSDLKLLD